MDHDRLGLLGALIERVRDFPDNAFNELFLALDTIEKKYGLEYPLSEEERQAIEESLAEAERGEFVPHEEVRALFAKALEGYDADADGSAALDDAVLRLRKRSGKEQGELADLIFTLLDEPRFDLPPPPPRPRRFKPDPIGASSMA